MKRTGFAAAALAAALALGASAASAATVYGTGVDLARTTPLDAIVARPEPWIGKTVKVEGLVVEVCESRGCWLELGGGDPPVRLRVKVEDGVMVFPMSARGRRAAVQGVVELLGGGGYPGAGPEPHGGEAGRHPAAGTLQIKATGAVVE